MAKAKPEFPAFSRLGRRLCSADYFLEGKWGNYAKLLPILRPYGTQSFIYAFSTYISPLTGRKDGYLIHDCPVSDKLLVENGLPYKTRPVRDAIWVKVIDEPPYTFHCEPPIPLTPKRVPHPFVSSKSAQRVFQENVCRG